jgi:hypothetical protein
MMRYDDDSVDQIDHSSTPRRSNMEGIVTVGELIAELQKQPQDAPVMIAVIKYPEEFAVRFKPNDDGDLEANWADSPDIELVPYEADDITMQRGVCTIAVELTDYSLQRHYAGG